jgi:hypothetical protein
MVDELLTGVGIAFEELPLAACPEFDRDNSLRVEVNELVLAVQNLLAGCPEP